MLNDSVSRVSINISCEGIYFSIQNSWRQQPSYGLKGSIRLLSLQKEEIIYSSIFTTHVVLEYSNTKMNLNCNFVSYKTLGVNSQWVLEVRTIKLVVLIQSKSTRNYNWYGTMMKNIFLDEILSIFFGVSPLPLKRHY